MYILFLYCKYINTTLLLLKFLDGVSLWCCTVVKHLTRNANIKGSNPAAGNGRERRVNGEKCLLQCVLIDVNH
jgi:hypothetical protein